MKSIFAQIFSLRRDSVLGESAPLLVILAAYIIAVYIILGLFDIGDRFVLMFHYGYLNQVAVGFSALFIILQIPQKSYWRYLTPRYIGGFLVIVLVAPLFNSAFSSFKQAFPLIRNFSFDYDLMRWDYFLHFGHHPWELLELALSHPVILLILDRLYIMWFLFLILFCLWMAWTKRRRLRLCYFVSTLLVWILLGSGLGMALSSAGPCYYSSVVDTNDDPFIPLMTTLEEIHRNTFLYAVHNQHMIWEARLKNHWLPFGGISAMPSIHLAMGTLFALVAFDYRKWLGMIFAGYLVILQIGSVILGWHYAIDGYAGMVLTYLIWIGIKRLVYRYSF